MHELTRMIKGDMVPALGVTEPGAIAFCAAKARSLIGGELVRLEIAMNSGMFKNAFTCGIPNSEEVGNVFAAALGYVAGDPDQELQSLANVMAAPASALIQAIVSPFAAQNADPIVFWLYRSSMSLIQPSRQFSVCAENADSAGQPRRFRFLKRETDGMPLFES